MVSTAMTITASRATTNPAISPVGSLGGLPVEPSVGLSVVEVVLDVLGEDVEVWASEGVEEWAGWGVEEAIINVLSYAVFRRVYVLQCIE